MKKTLYACASRNGLKINNLCHSREVLTASAISEATLSHEKGLLHVSVERFFKRDDLEEIFVD